MTGKKVSFGMKPGAEKSAEDWVTDQQKEHKQPAATGAMKRLTIDVSVDLHRQLKIKAASEGVRMADLVRAWITEKCVP